MSSSDSINKSDGFCDIEHEGEFHFCDDVVSGGTVGDAIVVCAGLLCDDVSNPVTPVCKVAASPPFVEVHAILLDDAGTPRRHGDEQRHRTLLRNY